MHDALESLFAELIAQQTKGRASFGTLSKTTYEYYHLRRYAQQFSSASEVKSILERYIANERKKINDTDQRCKNGISSGRIKMACRLMDLYNGDPICWHRAPKPKTVVSSYYESVVNQIEQILKPHYKKAHDIAKECRSFFSYLQKRGIDSIENIGPKMISDYLFSIAKRSTNTARTTSAFLKTAFAELIDRDMMDASCMRAFILPIKNRIKLKRPADAEKICNILQSIDTNTATGKRDYAILILAIATGLRSVDIANLKLSAFDWDRKVIRLRQSKTGQWLSLPLLPNVADAILDYLNNGRPESDDKETVFLSVVAPFKALNACGVQQALIRRRNVFGYDSADVTFHGLRHLRGTSLVSSGTPLPIVMKVLGHSNPSSTDRYLSFDHNNMQNCALSLALTYGEREQHDIKQ